MWVAMFVSFSAYTPLFFWARGNMSIDPVYWWKVRFHRSSTDEHTIDPDGKKRRAMGLIAYVHPPNFHGIVRSTYSCTYSYPLVFALIILPFSVVRWTSKFGSGKHSLTPETFATQSIYSLSGTFNVLLFLFTRTGLLVPHGQRGALRRAFWRSSDGSVIDVEVSVSRWEEQMVDRAGPIQTRPREGYPMPLKALPSIDDRSSFHGSVHKVEAH